MPNNTHKSAAVPFVNQKGERSMKRVKVERYVAGKKPSYAKEDDEEEYYTTDDEVSGEDEEYTDGDQDVSDTQEDSGEINQTKPKIESSDMETAIDDEDEDDDPRFRKLRQVDLKKETKNLLEAQTSSSTVKAYQTIEEQIMLADEGDEEEQEIKMRHALARARTMEEPLGAQVILGDIVDLQQDDKTRLDDDLTSRVKRVQTEDILGDFKLSSESKSKRIKEEKAKAEQRRKEDMERAARLAEQEAQLHKEIEEDNKREDQKAMLKKGGIGARDLELIKTDDEDEEIAYEEWKLRALIRFSRSKTERTSRQLDV